MIIYPALDLRDGKVVRLRGGDPAQQTIYGDDPVKTAERWIQAGAEWLHVINLDGALEEPNAEKNAAALGQLSELGIPIQFGGGLRTIDDVERAFDFGAARVVLGTMAAESPDTAAIVIARWDAEHVVIGLDARDGMVTTRGWTADSGVSAVDLGKRLAAMGAKYALYTDVARDGQLTGVNIAATVELARETGLKVIASGGISTLAEITVLRETELIEGVIVGTALYEGLIDLAEAIRLAKGI